MNGRLASDGGDLTAGPSNHWRRRVGVTAACLCWLLCGVGSVLHLTVRDRYDATAIVFYALPPIVMAGLLMVAAVLVGPRRRRRLGLSSLACGLVCLGWAYGTDYYRNEPRRPADPKGYVEVLFWNTCRGWFGWSRASRVLSEAAPDLIGLVEIPPNADFTTGALTEYDVATPGRGMALLARGEIGDVDLQHIGGGSICLVADVELNGVAVTAIVVDIKSNPFLSRRKAFASLRSFLKAFRDRPVLVMGDFNTPPDSVWIDELRCDFVEAFEAAGTGFAATWPVPAPVLTLDQVWVNSHLQVDDCRLLWTWISDHRPVLTRVSPATDAE